MPHLAFDLDALEKAPQVARAGGVAEDTVIAGLARMWRHCWRQKTDTVSTIALRGFFGADVSEALVTFELLASDETNAFRVRGAKRYLRIAKAQSEAGKQAAARGNLRRGNGSPTRAPETGQSSETSPALAGDELGNTSSSGPALTASSEQRTARRKRKTKEKDPRVLDVYAHYRDTFQRPQPEPSAEQSGHIQARLREGYSPEQLKKAVTGLSRSEFHTRNGYLAVKYALGSRENVERCMAWADSPPTNKTAPAGSQGPLKAFSAASVGRGADVLPNCEAPGCPYYAEEMGGQWLRYCSDHAAAPPGPLEQGERRAAP